MNSRLPVVHDLLGRLYTDAEWEALCNRCGLCCYESRWTGSEWHDTGVPCRYLDEDTKLCRAYGTRFQAEEDCIRTDPKIVLRGMLPAECSYLEEVERIVEEDYGGEDPRVRNRDRRRAERQERRRRERESPPKRRRGRR